MGAKRKRERETRHSTKVEFKTLSSRTYVRNVYVYKYIYERHDKRTKRKIVRDILLV